MSNSVFLQIPSVPSDLTGFVLCKSGATMRLRRKNCASYHYYYYVTASTECNVVFSICSHIFACVKPKLWVGCSGHGIAAQPRSCQTKPGFISRCRVLLHTIKCRSTFSNWASEVRTFAAEACEACLAHIVANKAEAAYRRGDQFEKRRAMLDAWAGWCEARAGIVVQLARA